MFNITEIEDEPQSPQGVLDLADLARQILQMMSDGDLTGAAELIETILPMVPAGGNVPQP